MIIIIIVIKEKTQCPCSTGIGSNCLLARLATKKAKPNGQFYLEPGMVENFMKNINISDVPGNLKLLFLICASYKFKRIYYLT